MFRRALGGVFVLVILITGLSCLSQNFTVKTSGIYSGTFVSIEGTYSGPMMFNFESDEEDIEVEGEITLDEDVI